MFPGHRSSFLANSAITLRRGFCVLVRGKSSCGHSNPHSHTLKFSQRLIRSLHHCLHSYIVSRTLVSQDDDRTRLSISSTIHSHNHTIFHLRLPPQRGLQVVRIDIQPCGSDDDFFLAPFEIKISGLIQRANIAGAIPTLLVGNILLCQPIPNTPRRHRRRGS